MNTLLNSPLSLRLMAVALGFAAMGAAHADGGRMMPSNIPAAYTAECAACHTGYAPGMLPARSWARIMSGLDQHYGSDASLDTATVKALSGWLQANAGTYKRVAEEPPQDRITRSAWFERKHRQVDDPAVWKLASVKSAANCAACHTGADKGRFDDDNLKVPAGLPLRFRTAFMD
jgi:mono/diheme cytochrome c family protein